MIKLEHVTKKFPGQTHPAVKDLSLEVPDGEICILVGPSGCGKTTTMRMVNRLIEPSGGEIFVEGRKVTQMDPIELRRNIGYVIQEIGLFPHMTIKENIGTVPRLLGWSKERTRARVDELLQLMGMSPEKFRDRYPHELSGGQRQRIGVARALAADPPIMLMDEPFGAIDPITRERLQNEFLRLQKEIRKTIIFVTHDIDEAIKMGDRIAILQVGGKLEQYGTPDEILSNPANEFVENFVGADRTLKRLNLVRAEEVMNQSPRTVQTSQSVQEVRNYMEAEGVDNLLVVDPDGHLCGYINQRLLRDRQGAIEAYVHPVSARIEPGTSLKDTLSEMLTHDVGYICVVGAQDRLLGLVTVDSIYRTVGDTYNERGGLGPRGRIS
jgi:osmoprotectant transport system ATP-binding protein